MPLVTDMLGRTVDVPSSPRRIVSLVPSQTELLADLGLEEEVVGITKFCIHPNDWFRSKTRVGGTKSVHTDRVAALKPDLIIANKEENVKEQIAGLEAIAPVWVSDIQQLEDALHMIKTLGDLCGKSTEGSAIGSEIEHSFAMLKPQRTIRVAYGIWRGPWMWAGGDTFINDLLNRAGFRNVLTEIPRYPEVSLVDLNTKKPDVVLLSSEPYPFKEQHIDEVKACIPDAKVVLVDGEMFSWYGSRLLQAPKYIADLLRAI